ncbi:hypothetical protein TorRG33x02_244120 [Trema orientale]|uniref:Uncharacterized protein n=1 Tax=Trema orientale TaxID=63057 RepID=A0A2P5DRU1_TREOI|nr:hypothetical protein TorRG33x02_244120 [Trema orientale]
MFGLLSIHPPLSRPLLAKSLERPATLPGRFTPDLHSLDAYLSPPFLPYITTRYCLLSRPPENPGSSHNQSAKLLFYLAQNRLVTLLPGPNVSEAYERSTRVP